MPTRYSSHTGTVTAAVLPNAGHFWCMVAGCVEYPTRNIAARLALTQRSSAWPAAVGGLNHWRALHGPYSYVTGSQWRSRTFPVPRRDSQISDAGTPAGIHVRQAFGANMMIAMRPITLSTSHLRLVAQDSDGLSRLRIAYLRGCLGRQCRPDASGEAVRSLKKGFRLATYAMWWIKGVDTRVHPSFVVRS